MTRRSGVALATLVAVAVASLIAFLEWGRDGGDASPADTPGPEPELASTPEFCAAADTLIGSLESMAAADQTVPAELELAYTDTTARLNEVSSLAPNVGVANQMGETMGLIDPEVELLSAADWDVEAIEADPEVSEKLATHREVAAPELDRLTGEFEQYVVAECGTDLVTARARGLARFYSRLDEQSSESNSG